MEVCFDGTLLTGYKQKKRDDYRKNRLMPFTEHHYDTSASDRCGVIAQLAKGAIKCGDFELLKFAHAEALRHGYELDCPRQRLTTLAAQCDDLDILMFLHENGYEWEEDTTAAAATAGSLPCLEYAHEKKCPWGKKTTLFAATNGHLHCLKYTHENGCEWDEETTAAAAAYGHFDCLKYAYENGCDLHKKYNTVKLAAKGRHWDCRDYLVTNGYTGDDECADFHRCEGLYYCDYGSQK